MCEFCEGDVWQPFYSSEDCTAGVVYDDDGHYVDICYEVDVEFDGSISVNAFVPINYCPMCGRKLAERGSDV